MAKDKRTIAEKVQDLEQAMINAYQMMNNMAADLQATKAGGDLLGSKTQAIINLLASAKPVTEDSVVAEITNIRIQRMADDVAGLVAQGIMAPTDTITDRTFVVGRDLSKDGSGTVVNPRIQFIVMNLEPSSQERFLTAKVGDILVFAEDKNQFEIQEAYSIQKRSEETAPEAEAAPEAEQAAQ